MKKSHERPRGVASAPIKYGNGTRLPFDAISSPRPAATPMTPELEKRIQLAAAAYIAPFSTTLTIAEIWQIQTALNELDECKQILRLLMSQDEAHEPHVAAAFQRVMALTGEDDPLEIRGRVWAPPT